MPWPSDSTSEVGFDSLQILVPAVRARVVPLSRLTRLIEAR